MGISFSFLFSFFYSPAVEKRNGVVNEDNFMKNLIAMFIIFFSCKNDTI